MAARRARNNCGEMTRAEQGLRTVKGAIGMWRKLASRVLELSFQTLPFRYLQRQLAENLVAPFYHSVADQTPRHLRHLYESRRCAEFEADIDFFLRNFNLVSLDDVLTHTRQGTPLPPRALFLSFDDGLREIWETVAPILKRKGVPATFFLNHDFLDNVQLCYRHKASLLAQAALDLDDRQRSRIGQAVAQRLPGAAPPPEGLAEWLLATPYPQADVLDQVAPLLNVDFPAYLRQERPYLDAEQVRALLRDGFSIGAHSLDHPRFAEITPAEQVRQTVQSVERLQADFGVNSRTFAFPFTSDGVERDFYDNVLDVHGMELLFCVGHVARMNDARVVSRVWMEQPNHPSAERMLRDYYCRLCRQRVARRYFAARRPPVPPE